MKKQTLKEKTKTVFLWAFGLSVLYFLIGAYLQSDGSEFDPKKTYELIKDTLSLAAAFLAPVTAFVLFNDWRVEHKIKSLFLLMNSIKETAKEIEGLLISYKKNIESRVIEVNSEYKQLNDLELIIKKLIELSFLYRDLEEGNHDLIDYKTLIQDFYGKADYLKTLLYLTEGRSVTVKKFESLNRTRGDSDQINPIPEKDLYEKDMEQFKREMAELERCLDNLIFKTKEIEKKYLI